MKSSRFLLFLSAFLFGGAVMNGQDCSEFFPQAEGTVLKYVNYDKKDKVTGSSEMSFKDKSSNAEGMSVVFASTYMDKNGEEVFENEVQVECRAGTLYFDAGKFLDPQSMSAYESMDIEITADNLELPLNGSAGTELKDGKVTAVISSNGVKIVTVSVEVFNRKIEATLGDGNTIHILAEASGNNKCVRCWHHRADVGENKEHPELCGRCVENVASGGETRHYA